MRLGIDRYDSKRVKAMKLVVLHLLMPLFVVVHLILHGVCGVAEALSYLPEQYRSIIAWWGDSR